ncbi:hypothetical protein TEA_022495 [Camellia sinensis var. sinensis]|uniref:Uncharacterized protein n=1 Tax=Camellia sinensis var. sinensis TaxID=542762 RepID=A0A4S4ER88_CAMSN|nr:hypothetical protein TEA_022495 [Camellia sinensis var. sinensis]
MWGICNKYEVLATMRKKRKQTQFWNPEDNNVEMEPSQPTLSSLYPLPHDCSMPSLTLARARSLNWKAWKKNYQLDFTFSILSFIKPISQFSSINKIHNFEREREREVMINVGMVVELLEEYRAAMARVREQLLVPRRMRMQVQFLRSFHSASTSAITAQEDSPSFMVYF